MTVISLVPKTQSASPRQDVAWQRKSCPHIQLSYMMRLMPAPGTHVFFNENEARHDLIDKARIAVTKLSPLIMHTLNLPQTPAIRYDRIAVENGYTSVVMDAGTLVMDFDEPKVRYELEQFSYKVRQILIDLMMRNWNALPFVSAGMFHGFKPDHNMRMALARLGLGSD